MKGVFFLFFSLPKIYIWVESESEMTEMHTQGNCFLFILYFCKTGTGPPQGIESSSFSSLLYFHESCTGPSQNIETSKFLLTFLPLVVWHKARAQSNMTSSRCLQWFSLLCLTLLVIKYSRHLRKFSWSQLQSAAYTMHVDIPSSSITLRQFTQHFCWRTPGSCLL